MLPELASNINWVGHIDWTVREFHGYNTKDGSTYNAYLVRDEKTALIDTVKGPYAGSLLAHIAELCDPASIDYIVCNHAEPDHSSALPEIVRAAPNAAIVCNEKCRVALSQHYHAEGWNFKVIGDGETLALGRRTLQFFNTPMAHWPESMATYVPEDGVLFSMDAFGQHLATSERFDDELPLQTILDAAKTYYANIVMPYGKPVQAALARLGALKLDIVAPSHGVIWRKNFAAIVAEYQKWAATKSGKKIVVIYSTMWNSTRQMAEAICEGAQSAALADAAAAGVAIKLIDVNATHDTQTVTEMMDAAVFAVGSATLNQGIMPAMARLLVYAKGLRPLGKKGFAFGSFGWAEKGATQAEQYLKEMGVELMRPVLTSKFRPTEALLAECRAAGAEAARLAANGKWTT